MAKKKRPIKPVMPWQAKPCIEGMQRHKYAFLGDDGDIYITPEGNDALDRYSKELKLWESQVTGNDAKEYFCHENNPSHRRESVRCNSCKHYAPSVKNGTCTLGKFVSMSFGTCNRGTNGQ